MDLYFCWMALLLHIDASGEGASVALSAQKELLAKKKILVPKEHGSFLQPAIASILEETGNTLSGISGVAVTIGPGSYTGLRVALASAKGICFAKNIPLITMPTTYVMAHAAKKYLSETHPDIHSYSLCPMIDARRMEVYLAVYDEKLSCITEPSAFILDSPEMISFSDHKPVFFFGTGAEKWKSICQYGNSIFEEVEWDAETMIEAARYKFEQQLFSPLNETVPLYVKPFYSTVK